MPEIVVYLAEGRTKEAKKGLMRDITEAVVKNLGSNRDHVVVQIMETPRHNKSKGGIPFDERTPTRG